MRAKRRRKSLRILAVPFVAAPPAGARIRTRLRLTGQESEVLIKLGTYLGGLYRKDLAARVRLGDVSGRDTNRTVRKRNLTAVATSRWAGSITRSTENQYQLAKRGLRANVTGLEQAVAMIDARLAAPAEGRAGRVRGYASRAERATKRQRRSRLAARLAEATRRLELGRPAIVTGGRRLAKARHHLPATGLTQPQWREQWDAARMFLTADGETGAPEGNYTITVTPDGMVSIALPAPLKDLANASRNRYVLGVPITFTHRGGEWADRVGANRSVRYDISYHPARRRWYLDASWSTPAQTVGLDELAGTRVLGVDLNADHFAGHVIDAHGNPVGDPITVPVNLVGPASQRDGRLRTAITALLRLAREQDCAVIAVENLGFSDARNTGRETMGRGRRGKTFRRTVAGIPTARFRERLTGMAQAVGIALIVVDPAYSSRWGGQHWRPALRSKTITASRHHGAAVVIARRAHGHKARRRPGVTRTRPEDRVGRATGQAVPATVGVREQPEPAKTARTTSVGKTRPASASIWASHAPKTVRGAPGRRREQRADQEHAEERS